MNVVTTLMEIGGALALVAGVLLLAGVGAALLAVGVLLLAGSWAVTR